MPLHYENIAAIWNGIRLKIMKNSVKKGLQIVFSYAIMFALWSIVIIGASDKF